MPDHRWAQEKKAIEAAQLAFDISNEAQLIIKQEALANSLNPPDQIRKILGLPYSKRPVRPRLTITLKAEDFVLLGQRYGLEPDDHTAIKERVAAELIAFAHSVRATG